MMSKRGMKLAALVFGMAMVSGGVLGATSKKVTSVRSTEHEIVIIDESTTGYPGAIVGTVKQFIEIDETTPGYPGSISVAP